MLILNLSTQDFAGTGFNRCESVRVQSGVEAYTVITQDSYLKFPYHLKLGLNVDTSQLQDLMQRADVIHVNEVSFQDSKQVWFGEPGVSVAGRFPVALPFDVEATEKVIIREQHSIPSIYSEEAFKERYSPQAYSDLIVEFDHLLSAGGGLLASNLDILPMHKAMKHISKPIGLASIRRVRDYYPRRWREDERLFVVQTVTLLGLVEKNTDLLEASCKNLRRRGLRVQEAIIKDQPHRISLMAKALCDVGFGHLRGFLDVSALESMAMGKPTIAFAGPPLQNWLSKAGEAHDYMPIVNCPPKLDALEEALTRLYSDQQFYVQKAREAEAFIDRFYNESDISDQYLSWIRELQEAKHR